MYEKRLREEDLLGLREDKLKSIRSFATFLAEDAADRVLSAIACYIKVSACSWLAAVQFYETNEMDLPVALLTAARRFTNQHNRWWGLEYPTSCECSTIY